MQFIKKLDYFPKARDEVAINPTNQGGIISILMFSILITLVMHEIYVLLYSDYLKHPYIENTSGDQRIR